MLLEDNSREQLRFLLECWTHNHIPVLWPIQGQSMTPFFQPGDTLILQPCQARNLRIGDIIIFYQNSIVVAHRLIAKIPSKHGWRFCQKGDFCSHWTWLQEHEIIGKAVAFQRNNTIYELEKNKLYWKNRILGWHGLSILVRYKLKQWLCRIFGMKHTNGRS